ncbi:MAG: GGDEF domain-containing protein [Eubacteriales bacterium]
MKEQYIKKSIYIIVTILALMVGIPIILICSRLGNTFTSGDLYAEDAYMDASSYQISESKPLSLSGEWNLYKGIFFDVNYAEIPDGYESSSIQLPTMDIDETQKAQTYQLFLSLDTSQWEEEEVYLSIPLGNLSTCVYLNGYRLEYVEPANAWLTLRSENILYDLTSYYDEELEYQEILISVPEEPVLTNLYNRHVSISTYDNYVAEEKVKHSLQLFLIGAMLTIIVVGLSYMVLVPSYSILTLMNLFDTALMLHLLFNISTIPNVALATMTNENWGCFLFRRFDLGFLMLAGFFGSMLGKEIFDPDNQVNKIFGKPILYIYAILIIVLTAFPQLMSTGMVSLLLLVTVYAFACVVVRCMVTKKNGKMDGYAKFHVVKTVFIGGIMLLDITTLNSPERNGVFLLSAYIIFFLVHLIIKAYEYRLLFVNIERMNEELEETVEERTRELRIANEELRDISTQDALTRCYNRLYFEEEFDSTMQKLRNGVIETFHLCMFDLDKFKLINDTYGHAEGDEQLVEAVQITMSYTNPSMEFARIGGEEFAILFINQQDEEVVQIVNDIRIELDMLAKERPERTTGSFGIYKANSASENRVVYASADKCLYHSKENGRNRITYDFGTGIHMVE